MVVHRIFHKTIKQHDNFFFFWSSKSAYLKINYIYKNIQIEHLFQIVIFNYIL